MITLEQLNKVAGNRRAQGARQELVRAIAEWAPRIGLDAPHRVALFLANVMHEAGGGRYLKELWGPTKAQRGYEGREDLGNTQTGDGKRFRGHGWIQTTGRANHRAVTKWARERFPNAPDFEKNPEKLAEPQWATLSALWYWSERVPARFIETGNHEMVRRRINGGLNGYREVLEYFDRAAMVILGFDPKNPTSIKEFQRSARISDDGVLGPMTRKALFRSLYALNGTGKTAEPKAPVVDHVRPVSQPDAPEEAKPVPTPRKSALAAIFDAIFRLMTRKNGQ